MGPFATFFVYMQFLRPGSILASEIHQEFITLILFTNILRLQFSNTEIEVAALKTADLVWEKVRSQVR